MQWVWAQKGCCTCSQLSCGLAALVACPGIASTLPVTLPHLPRPALQLPEGPPPGPQLNILLPRWALLHCDCLCAEGFVCVWLLVVSTACNGILHAPDFRCPPVCNPVRCLPPCRREAAGGKLHHIYCAAAGDARCEWVGGTQQVDVSLHKCVMCCFRAVACVTDLPCLPGCASVHNPLHAC